MFEIPDDDDNFWENLPIDEITNFDNAKQPKGKSGVESSKLLDKRISQDQVTPKSLHQSSQLCPPAFSFGFENKLTKKTNICNVSQKNTSRNSEDVSPASEHSGQNTVHTIKEVAIIHKILKPLENSATSNQLSESCSLNKEETNSSIRTSCNNLIENSTHEVDPSSPVTPQDSGLKRPWVFNDGSPDVDDFTPKRTRRKFPGPAGLLPKLRLGSKMEEVPNVTTNVEVKVPEETMILSSQSSDDVFCDSPWRRLLQDLGSDACDILKRFSVASSLQKAVKKQLPHGKVPLIFAVLESMDFQGTDAGVILKDKSGKIQGTFHRELVKEYASCLQTGVAFVLRQVGVISPNSRNHYLNITPNNIVSIYTHQDRNCVKSSPHNSSSQTLKELVQVIDAQTQKFIASTSHRNQSVSENVMTVPHTGSSAVLRTTAVMNHPHKTRLHQESERTPLQRSDVRTVLTPVRTPNCSTNMQFNTKLNSGNVCSPYSADSVKASSARPCQLKSSNEMSTPVKKYSFKPTANSPLQNHSERASFSREEHKSSSYTPLNASGGEKRRDFCNNNFQGNVSDSQKCILSCSSVLKTVKSLGSADKQQTPVTGQMQHTQAGSAGISTPKYSFKPKVLPSAPASSESEQSNIGKRTLNKDPSSATEVQNPVTNTLCESKQSRASQTNQRNSVNSISAKSTMLKTTSVDSASYEWDDELWQNGELELSDELLSQLSEDM